MLGVAVLCADDHERARLPQPSLATSRSSGCARVGPGPFPTPEEAAAFNPTPHEKELIRSWSVSRIVGDPEEVGAELAALLDRTGADELMVTTMVHGHDDRVRSYRLLAELAGLSPAAALGAVRGAHAPSA